MALSSLNGCPLVSLILGRFPSVYPRRSRLSQSKSEFSTLFSNDTRTARFSIFDLSPLVRVQSRITLHTHKTFYPNISNVFKSSPPLGLRRIIVLIFAKKRHRFSRAITFRTSAFHTLFILRFISLPKHMRNVQTFSSSFSLKDTVFREWLNYWFSHTCTTV